jgi:N-acetylmuramoyl-L-alanine amidase
MVRTGEAVPDGGTLLIAAICLPAAEGIENVGTTRPDRLRRQLLREAVEENLDTINGRPSAAKRRQRRRGRDRLYRAVLVSGVLVAAGASVAALVWDEEGWNRTGRLLDTSSDEAVRRTIAVPPRTPGIDEIVERLGVSDPQPLVPAVIPVQVGRIALDPGHGGVDGGASMGYGLLEKDLTKDIANRLGRLLTAATWEVVLTRTGDDGVPLRRRAEIANEARADLFVSIHVNWLPDRDARGFETYYLGPTDDPFLRRLASLENRDSGFALSDYRELLEGIYADVRHDQSRLLAARIQHRLLETLRGVNAEIVDRGAMTAPFAVLVTTDMPAVLVEVACLSNDREARLLALPRYRQTIAEALFSGVVDYAVSVTSHDVDEKKGTEDEQGT